MGMVRTLWESITYRGNEMGMRTLWEWKWEWNGNANQVVSVPGVQDTVYTKGYTVYRRTVCNMRACTKMYSRGPIVNKLTGVPGEKGCGKRGRPFIHHTHKIPPPLFMERITLSARDFEYFLHILDNPPPPSPRLRRLLTEPSIFDTEEGTLQTLQWVPPHHRTNTPSRSRT